MELRELTYSIIACCFKVHRGLGQGLLEQCYHNGLYYELKHAGLRVGYNVPFPVEYRGYTVGEYFADLLVEDKVIIEVKAVSALASAHKAQLLNYLAISRCPVGLLVNFKGYSLEWKRYAGSG
jgi:GxxExxY protein